MCTLSNFNKHEGVFAGLAQCVAIRFGHPEWQSCSEECEQEFDQLNSKCGDCHDPAVIDFLTTAAAGLGRCASCGAGTAEVVRDACCPDGRGCDSFGVPAFCDETCKATVTAAGKSRKRMFGTSVVVRANSVREVKNLSLSLAHARSPGLCGAVSVSRSRRQGAPTPARSTS